MSARDVMLKALCRVDSDDPHMPCFDQDEVQGRPFVGCLLCTRGVDAILAALADANYAIVPVTLLAKIPSDPPMSGLPQTELIAATDPPPSPPEGR